MPQTIQGFGTTFYGQRDFHHHDQSYITTEWIVFLYIPLFPIRSIRVIETGSEDRSHFPFMRYKHGYKVLETTRPNLKQTLYIYGFLLACACWVIGFLTHYDLLKQVYGADVAAGLWIGALMLPIPVPSLFRWYAKRKMRLSSELH